MSALNTWRVWRTARHSIRLHPRSVLVTVLLVAVCLMLAVALLGTGSLPIRPGDIMASLLGQGDGGMAERIILRVRLPRVLTGLLVGAALGAAGAIFQSISRNALGSPDIIGFTTGAASGALIQIILFDAGPLATAVGAVLAGLLTALVVVVLARQRSSSGGYGLVLIGIGMGATLSGLNQWLLVTGNLDQAVFAQLWLAGSLNTRTWAHVVPAAIGLLVILPLARAQLRSLVLLEMGDATARQLGVCVERVRLGMVLAAVALTSIATAAAGPIAFVALAAPQLARRLCGVAGVPLVSGAFMGAALLLMADGVSQHLAFAFNLPVGLVTGVIGGAYLIALIVRARER